MTFALIDVDGSLTFRPEPATGDSLNAVMPSECWAMVRLHVAPELFGFVDDAGHVMRLSRNPVGALMLAYFGANARGNPFCGPVAITGWREPSDSSEIRDLTLTQVQLLTERHRQLSSVLAGEDFWFSPGERAEMRAYAEFVRSGATPPVVVAGYDDFRDALRDLRGGS